MNAMSTKTQSQQMNAAIPASPNAALPGAPRSFGKIGLPAVMAAAEMLKSRTSDTKSPLNTSFVRSDD